MIFQDPIYRQELNSIIKVLQFAVIPEFSMAVGLSKSNIDDNWELSEVSPELYTGDCRNKENRPV